MGRGAALSRFRLLPRARGRHTPALALLALLLVAVGLAACTAGDGTTTAPTQAPTSAGGTTPTMAPGTTQPSVPTSAPPGQTETARLSPAEGPFALCQDCHAYLDPPGQVAATLMTNFRHDKHLGYGDVACDACHSTPAHQNTGIRKPLMADCFTCHGQTDAARAPGDCALCHPADFPRVPGTHTTTFRQGGHARVAEEQGPAECVICHEGTAETVCSTCHRVELPHPPGWNGTGEQLGAHVAAARKDAASCVPCHDNRLDRPSGCYGGECHGG